jgi:membrane-associated protease RseP (regulator of RpoE activity)
MSKRITLIMILAAFVAFGVCVITATAGKSDYFVKQYQADLEGAYLGVYLQDITSDLKDALDLESKKGALIAGVVEDSPAEDAGLEDEDVVIEVDGAIVKGSSHLTKVIRKHEPGDKITLKIIRDGKEKSVAVILGDRPESEFIVLDPLSLSLKMPKVGAFSLGYCSGSRIGVKVQDLSEQLGAYFGVEDGEGALISDVEEDAPAEKAGLKAGDVIVAVDGDDIEDTGNLVEAISAKDEGDKVKIEVIRDRKSMSFEVGVEKGEIWSTKLDDPSRVKIFSGQPFAKEKYLLDRESSKLEDEMEQLKEELEDLKEELEEMREKLK